MDNSKTIFKDWNLLNLDNSVFATFSWKNDQLVINGESVFLSDFETDYSRSNKFDFNPKMFYPETGLIIQFEFFKKEQDTFYVLTNKLNRTFKKLVFDKDIFITQTWEEHIFDAIIKFDNSRNPIHKKPNSKEVLFEGIGLEDYDFKAVRFNGDWIFVKCFDLCNSCPTQYQGWIKWKSQNEMILDLFFTC